LRYCSENSTFAAQRIVSHFQLSDEFPLGFRYKTGYKHSSTETPHEKPLTGEKPLSRTVVVWMFLGRIGSADHGVGRLNAANYRWLTLIGEFDRRQGWADGFLHSCAHWLNFKCGLDLGAAREKVRVASALPGRGPLSPSCLLDRIEVLGRNAQKSRLTNLE
jgi:hypothetical protein